MMPSTSPSSDPDESTDRQTVDALAAALADWPVGEGVERIAARGDAEYIAVAISPGEPGDDAGEYVPFHALEGRLASEGLDASVVGLIDTDGATAKLLVRVVAVPTPPEVDDHA